MREDSWRVQRRLTAKRRWQRGKSWRSLCERFLVILFSCSRKVFGDVPLVWGFVLGRLQKINAGFKALKTYFLKQSFTMSDAFLTGLKWKALTWKKMSHISISAPSRIEQHLNQSVVAVVGLFAHVFSTVSQIWSNLTPTFLMKQSRQSFWLLNSL